MINKILCPECKKAFFKPGWISSILACPKCGYTVDRGDERGE